jgi:hypothetical protein
VDGFRLIFALYLGMSRYDRPSHRIYMSFFIRSGWQVQFLEPDLKTPLPRTFSYSFAEYRRSNNFFRVTHGNHNEGWARMLRIALLARSLDALIEGTLLKTLVWHHGHLPPLFWKRLDGGSVMAVTESKQRTGS